MNTISHLTPDELNELISGTANNMADVIIGIVYKTQSPEFKASIKPYMVELIYPGLDINISYASQSEVLDDIIDNTLVFALTELQGCTLTVFNSDSVGDINKYFSMLEIYNMSTPSINSTNHEYNEWEFNPDCIMPDGSYSPDYSNNPYSASTITLSEWFDGTVFVKPLTFTHTI